jgi:hypothetical protein
VNWACRSCGSILLIGVMPCSNCQGDDIATDPKEVDEAMAKISKALGVTRFTPEPTSYDAFTLQPVGEQGEREAGPDDQPLPPAATDSNPDAVKLPAEPQKTGEGDPKVVDDGYDKLTPAQLQQELKKRDLSDTGKKDELVARLREHDKQKTATKAPAADSKPQSKK